MKNKNIILILILCGFVAVGCSFRRLAFQNIDWLAMRRIDSVFDITSKQSGFLEPKVHALVEWVKVTNIKKIIAILAEMKKRFQKGMTATDRVWSYDQIDQVYAELIRKAAHDMATFLATLNSEQVEHFENYLKKRNERILKFVQKAEPEYKKQIKGRLEHRFKKLERLFGDLTEKQKSILHKKINFDQSKDRRRYKHRLETQEIWISLIKTRDYNTIKNFLDRWATDRTAGRSKEYKQYFKGWEKRRSINVFRIIPVLLPRQKQHFNTFIDELIEDLKTI